MHEARTTKDHITQQADGGCDPDVVSIEVLDEQIVSLSARLTAHEYRLLVLIRSFDERGGWLKWGAVSCAHWLHWRCDLSLSAAREKLRVAHALKTLPLISRAFATGALSYSKVRALTRVADSSNEAELLAFAREGSAALVEQRCQQHRNVRTDSTDVANRAHTRRALSAFREPRRGSMTLTVELPLEDGELVLTALDRVLATESAPADSSTSYRARQTDALLTLCREALTEGCATASPQKANPAEPTRSGIAPATLMSATAQPYQVLVHVDADALTDQPGASARSDLPVETVRRLTCDGAVVAVADAPDGTPRGIGRRRRTVSRALKRAIFSRDRHCRFPGCTHGRFVDAHHVQHWADGAETTLENLILLCDHHHRLVHEGGFQIAADNEGRQFFRRPDGRAVPACGYRLEDRVDEPCRASAGRQCDAVSACDPSTEVSTEGNIESDARHPASGEVSTESKRT